jgi:hypothetical protein
VGFGGASSVTMQKEEQHDVAGKVAHQKSKELQKLEGGVDNLIADLTPRIDEEYRKGVGSILSILRNLVN